VKRRTLSTRVAWRGHTGEMPEPLAQIRGVGALFVGGEAPRNRASGRNEESQTGSKGRREACERK
jgi:hypothetical protein